MREKTLALLEYPKVLARIARQTSFSAGREFVDALRPTSELDEIARRQETVADALRLLEIRPNFSLGGVFDVRETARQAALGAVIEPQRLLQVQSTLVAARTLRQTILRLRDQLPALAELARPIGEHVPVEREIIRCLGPRGEVLDSASPTLGRIRHEIREAHDQLLNRLNQILASETGRLVAQEPIVTLRENRYVIPIKAEMRGRLRGVLHDTSASGATLFVEPFAVVDLNNRWREYQLEEEKEVERVLRRLGAQIGLINSSIQLSVACLAAIDAALAAARYAASAGAALPHLLPLPETGLDDETALNLVQARHPLLTGEVVPIDVRLGGGYRALVITGPNTGGKTVALKTTGLLTLMAQAGLPIPAEDGSTVPVFDAVYADIGDEQSIEQSLSTFSAHITNIIDILDAADSRSLVLLDELGAGTDPAEGSILARALLSRLLEKRVAVMATTHYSELKWYAHTTPGVRNASVEFDVQTLRPTYKLEIGLPGRSNALAIAERLGLDPMIVAEARGLAAPSTATLDELLDDIRRDRDTAARELVAARAERQAAEQERQVAALTTVELAEERDQIADTVRAEVLAEMEDLQRQLRAASAALRRAEVTLPEVQEAQQQVTEAAREVRRRRRPRVRKLVQRLPKVGDLVLVRSLDQTGELVSLPDGPDDQSQAEVQIGPFKIRVAATDLEQAPSEAIAARRRQQREERNVGRSLELQLGERTASPQIDLRGQRAEDVLPMLDQYLNEAYLAGLPQVRVVHGKGTGVLRQVVRDQLAQHPLVRGFGGAAAHDGGEGVTVATLAT